MFDLFIDDVKMGTFPDWKSAVRVALLSKGKWTILASDFKLVD